MVEIRYSLVSIHRITRHQGQVRMRRIGKAKADLMAHDTEVTRREILEAADELFTGWDFAR